MARRSNGTFKVYLDDDEVGYNVKQIVIHPDFEPMGPADIALVRLERPVTNVRPVALYQGRDEQGKTITLVGHGDTKPGTGGEWKADGKKRGATNIIDAVTNAHIQFDFDPPGAGTQLEGTAGPGDSGGPAFLHINDVTYIAGVSSLGEPGEQGPGTYGAREHYVRVSSHLDWIRGVLASPPTGSYVNRPEGTAKGTTVRRSGPGGQQNLPQGVVLLEEIGLMVAERNGKVRMVGRIDELYPASLLSGGIRPPAALLKINEDSVTSADDLKARFDTLPNGAHLTLTFEHKGKILQFELVK